MKIQNRQKGNLAEEKACQYLEKNGWSIIKRNFQTRWGEIDIIASKDTILSFIEVKAKTSDIFGTPEQMINKTKMSQIQRTSELFLQKNSKITRILETFRIDVIAITLTNNEVTNLNYYENVGAEFV